MILLHYKLMTMSNNTLSMNMISQCKDVTRKNSILFGQQKHFPNYVDIFKKLKRLFSQTLERKYYNTIQLLTSQ